MNVYSLSGLKQTLQKGGRNAKSKTSIEETDSASPC